MTENIFLSYRRDDSRGYTNAIYTLLELHFPADSIFMDVDTLIPGSDFVQSLEEAVENCDIFLAIIGSRWENIEDNKGLRRLENPEDFVRIEVAHALKRGIPVIPVLVDGAQMPFTENLPDNIKDLARRHAFSIGDHMRSDVQRLIKVLEKTFERLEKERLVKEKEEAELLAMAQAEEERKTQEKAEADRKAKEQTEADQIAKDKTEADRKAKEEADAEREAAEEKERLALQQIELERLEQEKAEVKQKAREKAEEELKTKAEAEAEQKAKEEAETERKAADEKERLALQKAELERQEQNKIEAERKANAEAEAERKAKKEAKQKARALAAAEKKADDDNKRLSRLKTKTAVAQQEEKSSSSSPSALNKIPVWVWPAAGVFLILIGYGIFGGYRPTSSEESGETGVSQAFPAITNTPPSEAISSTPTPDIALTSTAVPTPIPTAEPPDGAEISNLLDGALMLYVSSGEFIMGSDSGEANESPAHTIYLDGFWIGKTEVTNEMYRLCVEAGACFGGGLSVYETEAYDNHPVVSISWTQADNYCRWSGGRLPTEAEWEKAARGTNGRTYPWGEGIDGSLANYGGFIGGTSPVGSYPADESPYGLWDMAGNVAEFVADWYDHAYYPLSPEVDPLGPEDGLERVVRGGSWEGSESNSRVSNRDTAFPDEWRNFDFLGFRCANSATPQGEPPVGAESINSLSGAVMVYVPSGEFIMGSDSGETNESPAHTVFLDGFWIGKTEVTNAMYRLCVEADACFEGWHAEEYVYAVYDNHPVVNIGWKQANNYCRWSGGYLPTEAQWEKAARGTNGRTYPWGEGIDGSLANYGGFIGSTSPVGRYPAGVSPYGLLDMAGNVGEFVADWYDSAYYLLSPDGDPLGPEDGLERVVRGGSWNSSEINLRVSSRSTEFPDEWQSNKLGFRCASSATPLGEDPVGAE